MKKAVVLGMILLVLGCMAYADGGVTVGMDFGRSQFVLAQGSSTSGAPVTEGWAPLSGTFPTVQRYDMEFAWSNDHVGINMTAYTQPFMQMLAQQKINGLAGIGIDWVNMYGTLKLVPNMFTTYLGRFEGDGWDHFRLDSDHPIHDMDNNSIGRFVGWGMILDLMPKDSGFDGAVFLKTADPTSIALQNVANQYTLAQTATDWEIAASYTVPNLIKISAGSTTFSTYSGTFGSSERNIFGRVEILMIPNLSLWDQTYYAGFDQSTKISIVSSELGLDYNMKPLQIILAAFAGENSQAWGTYGQGGGGADYTQAGGPLNYKSWALYPEVIYNMGAISLGVYGGLGGTSTSGTGINYKVEPYVKLNDFGLRVSFLYAGSSQSGTTAIWEIPIIVDWGF
jgi:hypothetical protein